MRRFLFCALVGGLLGLTLLGGNVAVANDKAPIKTVPPLRVVDAVDVTRYMGKWYEVALFPNRFQAQCIADTTATYTLQSNGRIEVRNRCKKADGAIDEAVGEAKFADSESTAKLKVRFAPWYLAWLPQVWGDYWVIELEPSYRYAIVSEPSRQFLWILSRTPKLDDKTVSDIRARLTIAGFDVTKLQVKPQSISTGGGPNIPATP